LNPDCPAHSLVAIPTELSLLTFIIWTSFCIFKGRHCSTPNIVLFVSVGGEMPGCFVGGLSELSYKCVTHV
jgi:hypothetical protein